MELFFVLQKLPTTRTARCRLLIACLRQKRGDTRFASPRGRRLESCYKKNFCRFFETLNCKKPWASWKNCCYFLENGPTELKTSFKEAHIELKTFDSSQKSKLCLFKPVFVFLGETFSKDNNANSKRYFLLWSPSKAHLQVFPHFKLTTKKISWTVWLRNPNNLKNSKN